MRALWLIYALGACNNILLLVLGKTFDGAYITYCDRQNNGQIYCWGDGSRGQMGNGVYAVSPFPVKMLNVHNATDVGVGYYHTCIVDRGKVKCTGAGRYLGRSSGSTDDANTLVAVDGVDYTEETVDQVFAGWLHSCLVTSSGGAKCWGRKYQGQLGNSEAVEYNKAFPVTGFETSGVSSMALASEHTCLLNTLGKVYCAGYNDHGQLGRGTTDVQVNAEMLPVAGETVMVSITSGSYHTCALSSTATVYCWGVGYHGQLGQGSTTSRSVPTIVPDLSDIVMIWAGDTNTFVLQRFQGRAKAFGRNSSGELGLLTDRMNKVSPVTAFLGETNIVDIKGGYTGACGKFVSGVIRCYGSDALGQLGNGLPRTNSYFLVDVLYLPATSAPTALPTVSPTHLPTVNPTTLPTALPTVSPTHLPNASPTLPTAAPTALPTASPTVLPTASPTASPTLPTASPTVLPTTFPTASPTIIIAVQDLSLVGLVALVPVAAAVGAVAYCKFIKPPATAENVALQASSSLV